MDRLARERLSPFLNFHRPCLFATKRVDAKGKVRRTYHPGDVKTPLEDDAAAREANYEARWQRGGFGFLGAYNDLLVNRQANETAAEFVRGRIRDIVDNPQTARLLCPDNVIGYKRPCLDTHYFETYNRPNVSLVDVRANPIERITPAGIVAAGEEHALDCIVFATGFDAMTGAVLGVDIRGRGGLAIQRKWDAGPMRQARPPARFGETPAAIFRCSPELGEHTREVLAEAGYSADEITDLRERKVVR